MRVKESSLRKTPGENTEYDNNLTEEKLMDLQSRENSKMYENKHMMNWMNSSALSDAVPSMTSDIMPQDIVDKIQKITDTIPGFYQKGVTPDTTYRDNFEEQSQDPPELDPDLIPEDISEIDSEMVPDDIPDIDSELSDEDSPEFMQDDCPENSYEAQLSTTTAQQMPEASEPATDKVTHDNDIRDVFSEDSLAAMVKTCDQCSGLFLDFELPTHVCKKTSNDKVFDVFIQPKDIKPPQKKTNSSAIRKMDANNQRAKVSKSKSKENKSMLYPKRKLKLSYEPKNKKSVEEMSARTKNDLGPWTCQICNKTLSRRSGLTIHMRRHNGDMPFECEECDKKFPVLYDLDRHMRMTHGSTQFSCFCDVCRKPFVTKSGLIEHKKLYHRHSCDVCGKAFNMMSQLANHKIIHDTEIAVMEILRGESVNSRNGQLLKLCNDHT